MLLNVEDLHIEIHDRSLPETVIYDVDLTMEEGEILGLVGESGSGKSMTAHAIAGLLRRQEMKKQGKILFKGQDLLTASRAELRKLQGKEIGVVFQEPMSSLNPARTIGWQMEEALIIHTDLDAVCRKKEVLKALQDVELTQAEEIVRKYPHELSGGMRQRVMIASAMICNPSLLIADEPTTALDVTVQAQIIQLLRNLNQERHMGILFISHDLSLVRQLCTRVIVMQGGYVVEEGLVEDVFTRPKEDYTKRLLASIPKVDLQKERVHE